MTPQMTATMTADHPRPVAEPMAHHRAMDTNSDTKYPATAAPPSIPAPLPARVAVCCSSALASSSSCRIRVDRSVVTSEINSPSDRSPTDSLAWAPTSAEVLMGPGHHARWPTHRPREERIPEGL